MLTSSPPSGSSPTKQQPGKEETYVNAIRTVPRVRAAIAAVVALSAASLLAWSEAAGAGAGRTSCETVELAVSLAPDAPAEHTVSGDLCRPAGGSSRLEILLSGASYGRSYWDPPYRPSRYSYVRATLAAGNATLNVDRIGNGDSSHPSAPEVTVVTQAHVTHQLVQAARSGRIGGTAWRQVLTVGHSLGSAIALVEAARYHDVDGLILTGFLAHAAPVGAPDLVASLQPAQLEARFLSRPPGYLTTREGTRGRLFYHAPGADADLIAIDERTKETLTPFELATLSEASQTSVDERITVPVLSVTGEFDNVFCPASCAGPRSPVLAEPQHYPNAPCFTTYVVPDSGHVVNLHRTAPAWFAVAQTWLRSGMDTRCALGPPHSLVK
jgi:pimeloyl-ACP methyl ester carboxylesterase